MLRSKATIPPERLLPLCIATSESDHTFRFEQTAAGCVGQTGGKTWKHVYTLHTSKDADGEEYCVGSLSAGPKSRWSIQQGVSCNDHGFRHSFTFRSMTFKEQRSVIPICLLTARKANADPIIRRLSHGKDCPWSGGQDQDWQLETEIVLLAKRHAASDHQICFASGTIMHKDDASKSRQVFRVFYDDACKQQQVDAEHTPMQIRWTISQSPEMFVPEKSQGDHFCLCYVPNPTVARTLPYFTWVQDQCPGSSQKEMCFSALSPSETVNTVHLIDDM